jgi:hypothetical protein
MSGLSAHLFQYTGYCTHWKNGAPVHNSWVVVKAGGREDRCSRWPVVRGILRSSTRQILRVLQNPVRPRTVWPHRHLPNWSEQGHGIGSVVRSESVQSGETQVMDTTEVDSTVDQCTLSPPVSTWSRGGGHPPPPDMGCDNSPHVQSISWDTGIHPPPLPLEGQCSEYPRQQTQPLDAPYSVESVVCCCPGTHRSHA